MIVDSGPGAHTVAEESKDRAEAPVNAAPRPSQVKAPASGSHTTPGAPGQPNPLHKVLFEKVKRGEVDEVVRFVRESGIDITKVNDEPKNFCQNPAFSACIIRDEQVSL